MVNIYNFLATEVSNGRAGCFVDHVTGWSKLDRHVSFVDSTLSTAKTVSEHW